MKVSYRIKISLRVLLCGGNNNDDGGNVSNDDDRDISDDHNDNDRGDSGDIGGDADDGDLLVNRDGVRIVSQNDVEAVTYFSHFSMPSCLSNCLCVYFNIYPLRLLNCLFCCI